MMEWQCFPSQNVLIQRSLTLELTQFYKEVIAPIQGGLSSNNPRTQLEIKKEICRFKKFLYINFTILDCAHKHQFLLLKDRPQYQLPNATYKSHKGPILVHLCLKMHTSVTNSRTSSYLFHKSFNFWHDGKFFYTHAQVPGSNPWTSEIGFANT